MHYYLKHLLFSVCPIEKLILFLRFCLPKIQVHIYQQKIDDIYKSIPKLKNFILC